MKKKLLLATNTFPFESGEAAFIIPELRWLKEEYDITVISHAAPEQSRAGYVKNDVLNGLQILYFPCPVLTMADKIKAIFSYLGSRDGRREIREICKSRQQIGARLYQSLSFYAQAMKDRRELRNSRVIPQEEPVIYYSFWNTYYCYSMVREGRRHKNVRMVSRLHGFDLYHERIPGSRQPFKHQMEQRLDGLIFLADFARAYYRDNTKAADTPQDKLYVCPLGIERAGRKMPPRQGEALELLSCSDVIPLKRVERIVDGLAQIEQGRFHWTHIGDGGQFARIKSYADEKLAGKDNVCYTFKGRMEHSQVLKYYETEQVDCFITTSSTEGVPVSIMEAMAYGIPVIGTAVGGIPEMIDGNGILLQADPTAEDVARALTVLAQADDEEFGQMKEKSLRMWGERYDVDVSVRELLGILG